MKKAIEGRKELEGRKEWGDGANAMPPLGFCFFFILSCANRFYCPSSLQPTFFFLRGYKLATNLWYIERMGLLWSLEKGKGVLNLWRFENDSLCLSFLSFVARWAHASLRLFYTDRTTEAAKRDRNKYGNRNVSELVIG
jgi:hypothetical protein